MHGRGQQQFGGDSKNCALLIVGVFDSMCQFYVLEALFHQIKIGLDALVEDVEYFSITAVAALLLF